MTEHAPQLHICNRFYTMWFEMLSPILFDSESFCRYSRKFDISKRVKACRGVGDQQTVRSHFGIRLIYRARTLFPSSFCFAVPSFFRWFLSQIFWSQTSSQWNAEHSLWKSKLSAANREIARVKYLRPFDHCLT